jgi:hypothetical protein
MTTRADRVWTVPPTGDHDSMRYSRMLEESSFANRKADYFWLLFLSALMLLVRLPPYPFVQSWSMP